LHQQPYYGTPQKETDLRAGEHKAGTNQFHTFATLYVMRNGRRVTLALHFVRGDESMVEVLSVLKAVLDEAGLRVGLWLADKGFASVQTLQWFSAQPAAFVPLPLNGRKDPPSATRALAALPQSCWRRHTMETRNHKERITFDVAVDRRPEEMSRSGKLKKPRTLLYAVVGSSIAARLAHLQPSEVTREYSRRFGIESSYRQVQQARGRTSSRSPLLRLLYFGIALLLRNLWILCCWMLSAHKGPGARPKRSRFTLEEFLRWLLHHLQSHLHFITELPLPAPSEMYF
jgi:putative transposase